MRIESYQTLDVFEALKPEWNPLLRRSPADALFLTWEFQSTWWACLGKGHELRVLTARGDDGRLVGIAPLYVERDQTGRGTLRLLGGLEVADYLDFIIAPDQARECMDAFFTDLCNAGDWRALDLRNVPAASPTREIVPALAASRHLPFTSRVEEVCPVIMLGDSFDAYLESLDKKQRHEIRRKTRKAYDEAEIRWHCVDGAQNLDEAVEGFIDLHQRSKAGKDEFMTSAMGDFFRALARATYDAGWLELAFIAVNGRQAAAYFNFVYNDATLCYNSGYDPHAYAALSPGIVLLSHLIEHAIRHRRKVFDFLQGNETYKYRMGAHDTHVYQLTVERP
jgi:CelD/BcsL family acetyltransferase involved in cellulose biosynthesis